MASSEFLNQLEKSIESIESNSSAEVMVSMHDSSADYSDIDLIWGILFGLGVLAYKIWSPYSFDPDWVLFNVVLCGLMGFALSRWVWPLRRFGLSTARIERNVRRAALAQFLELGVNGTREQTGILLYVSRFERRLLLVPDVGLKKALSPTFWDEVNQNLGRPGGDSELLANISAILDRVKKPLQKHFPRPEDDIDELPNRPVQIT